MRRFFLTLMLCSTLSLFLLATQDTPSPFVPGDILVKLMPKVSIERLLSAYPVTLSNRLKDHTFLLAIQEPEGKVTEDKTLEMIAQIKEEPGVIFVEPNYLWFADRTEPNEFDSGVNPNFSQNLLDAMNMIGAPEAWSRETGNQNLIVAVIDTGGDPDHEDVSDNQWINGAEDLNGNRKLDSEDLNGIDDDGNGFIDDVYGWNFIRDTNDIFNRADDLHGCHVSGTIGAQGNNGIGVAGVAWDVQIMRLAFLGSSQGSGSTDNAIKAIDYAIDNGAKIINASWGGGPFSQGLLDAIGRAKNAGILFVAAAGNDGLDTDARPHYPSSYDQDNIISVAAVDFDGNLANFSNYGQNSVDLAGPGVDIYSMNHQGGYSEISGTSQATPHVSGSVALLWSAFPTRSYSQIRQALLSTVTTDSSLDGNVATGGFFNIDRAFTCVESNFQTCNTVPNDESNDDSGPCSLAPQRGADRAILAGFLFSIGFPLGMIFFIRNPIRIKRKI